MAKGRAGYSEVMPPEYNVWLTMMQRCHNPKHPGYKVAGAIGVVVCERWHDFSLWLRDAGLRPDGFVFSRHDKKKGFSPDNACWMPRVQGYTSRSKGTKTNKRSGIGSKNLA